MWRTASRATRIVISLAITGLFLPVSGADQKVDKRKSQADYQRGVRADSVGSSEDAIAAYTAAIRADENNQPAWRNRGKDYFQAGELEKAANDLEQAVKLMPGDPQAYAARAELYRAREQYTRAVQYYNTSIALKLERTEVYNGLGLAEMGLAQYQAAEAAFSEAIRL